jgi:two-component system OmpR family response regulator
VILDISLGDDSEAGFHLCTELRRRSESVPIIFLTCHDSDFDKISGMRLGADDYITKDVNVDYLVVRIRALLRRVSILSKRLKEKPQNKLQRGDLMLNMDTLKCTWKDKPLDFSLTQLWMLHDLVSNRNQVRSTEQIMDAANMTVQPSTVAGHIMNIRKVFQTVDPNFSAIRTERGIGYRWMEK